MAFKSTVAEAKCIAAPRERGLRLGETDLASRPGSDEKVLVDMDALTGWSRTRNKTDVLGRTETTGSFAVSNTRGMSSTVPGRDGNS